MTLPTPPVPAGTSSSYDTAEQNMENAVNQLIADRAAMQQSLADLLAALEKMKEEIKAGHSDIALMIAFMQIFPAIFKYKQDNMVQLADSENIASGLRSFVNNAATAFNGQGKDANNADAKDLYANATALDFWSQYLSTANSNWDANSLPLDPTDANNIDAAFVNIKNQFNNYDNSTQDPVNPNSWDNKDWTGMNNAMKDWYAPPSKDPTSGTPGDPAPQIKAIQGAFQTSNSAVSTLATTTQTQEQFYTNEYNQITGITNSLQQAQATQTGTLVHNQKAG